MTFDQWELSARLALADRGIDYHTATPPIEDARAHCEATGQSPHEAFGTPAEFAAATADELPADLRAEVDRHGLSAADHLTGQLFGLAVLLLGASVVFALLERTLSFPVTPAGLTGTVLLALTLPTARGLPDALRAAGRPELVRYAYLAAGVLVVLTGTAFTTLPREPFARVPVLGLVAVSVVALGLLTRAPKPRARRRPRPHSADDNRDAWLARLTGVLIGRYDLPPERAADLVREARAHLEATGAAPRDEFGPLDDYARRLAEPEQTRRDPWWRTRPATMLSHAAGIVTGVCAFADLSADGHVWAAWLVALPVTAAIAWQLVTAARGYVREQRTT